MISVVIASLASLVNPLIGTDYTGNTYPGAQAPHGMVQLSPDNGLPGWDRIAGYFYPDSTIAGFSHTHLSGTGAGDMYDISFMPSTAPFSIAEPPLGLHSRFSHEREAASAGYYAVHLDDYDIDVELTALPRTGVQRYRWHCDTLYVTLNLDKSTNWDKTLETDLRLTSPRCMEGYRHSTGWARDQNVWFATRFSHPVRSVYRTKGADGGDIVRLAFVSKGGGELTVVTSLSGTDAEGAWKNLATEAPHDDFDNYLQQSRSLWNDKLSAVDISETDNDKRTVFYTALYHSLLAPVVYSDVDGRYRGADGKIYTVEAGHNHYHLFSLWDTYRAAHPLYTILEPRETADMVNSLLDFTEQNGRLPVWSMWGGETDMMIGYHSAAVITEAIAKGIPGIDEERALGLCLSSARNSNADALPLYRQFGYVPCDLDSSWSMSKTLEYAYDDACIARLAQICGDSAVAGEFDKRASNYKNSFNPATRFMQPRRSDGSFLHGIAPTDYSVHICESNGWHYLWNVQHDIEGLKTLLGGRDSMALRLDRFFTLGAEESELPIFSTGMIGQYAHGNEPSHHVAYLYNAVGEPEKGRHYLRRIMTQLYNSTPAGLCGNEDCGQTSAWYVLSALGFYPVDPTSATYQTGTPLYNNATIRLPNGKTFEINAPEEWDGVSEVQILLNGKPVAPEGFTHSELMEGGKLEFINN